MCILLTVFDLIAVAVDSVKYKYLDVHIMLTVFDLIAVAVDDWHVMPWVRLTGWLRVCFSVVLLPQSWLSNTSQISQRALPVSNL